jgi:helicase
VLDLQERIADVAFTLDFPIPPGMDAKEAAKRQKLTIANAHWAIENRRRTDLRLYGVVQAWDAESAKFSEAAKAFRDKRLRQVAEGKLNPARKFELITFGEI